MASAKPAFTVETPVALEIVERKGEHWWVEVAGRRLRLSNLDKVFWPDEGYTKGDLVAYYLNVAHLILPYLEGRPLTMKRMPDGADGPFFYEKQAPSHTPDWMQTCAVSHEDSMSAEGTVHYLMARDAAALLFVANLGCIEFHPLHSRCGTIDEPDYLFFDLDPFEPATFDDVLAVALHVRAAMGAFGLECYPKTSGATGMQIYTGLAPGYSYEDVRILVGEVGRHILRADRERVTMEPQIPRRKGKVYIDHNMNRRGANIAAVYSVRPEAGATVSTPLTWAEVEAGVHPSQFTIRTVHERFSRTGDLFDGMLTQHAVIDDALSALGLVRRATPVATSSRAEAPQAPTAEDDDTLAEYRRKRDFGITPEPGPAVAAPGGNRFVIQKHNATRLHFDLRLEKDGVMPSWAVPKGLPTKLGERRLAVQTEDHPLEYADFEAIIPKGEYGAGEVRIFDSGTYEALEWTDNKVTFRLHGARHRGEYHMVKTRQGWLVMLSRESASEQPPSPPGYEPMLAELVHEPFDDERFVFEPKLDGVRTLAYVTTDATRLVSRTGRDHTLQYPELANLALWVNALQAVIDGEIVAMDGGRASFQRLQQRVNLTDAGEIDRIRHRVPVTLYAFDLLWLDGEDLTSRALEERRAKLDQIVTESERLRLTMTVPAAGRQLFEASKQLGLEGIVAKRLGSSYQPGKRTRDWRKIKALRSQDCVVIGYLRGEGSRASTFSSLLVSAYVDGVLTWTGQVGTGFTGKMLQDTLALLEPLRTEAPPFDDPEFAKLRGRAVWVRPELVCEVEYLQITDGGRFRAPSFKGMRPDKAPADCVLQARPASEARDQVVEER